MGGTMFRQAILAAAMGLGVWAGLARAQGLASASQAGEPTPQSPPAVIVVNGATYVLAPSQTPPTAPVVPAVYPEHTPDPSVPVAPPNPPASANNWWVNHKHFGCWANFNGYSCGSWESEAAFIFGSSRNFFGEPCAKGPPPPAYPGEYIPRNILPNCKCYQP